MKQFQIRRMDCLPADFQRQAFVIDYKEKQLANLPAD